MTPTPDLTRRGLLAGGTAAAALLALAACTPGRPGSTAAGATREATIAGKRYRIPSDPTRVVSIDYFSGVFLTELGLAPVGGIDYSWVDDGSMLPAYVAPLKRIHDIGKITTTNLEKVAALNPDLVIGPAPGSAYDNSKGALTKLRSIAPAVAIDFGSTGDWRPPYEQTAQAVGRTAEHAARKKHYADAVAAVRAEHGERIAATTLASVNFADDGQFAVDTPPSSAGVVYGDLGFRFTERARSVTDANGVNLSFENVGDLADADVILYRADANGTPGAGLPDLLALEAWKRLPAVAAGRALPITWIDLCTYRWAELAVSELATIVAGLDATS